MPSLEAATALLNRPPVPLLIPYKNIRVARTSDVCSTLSAVMFAHYVLM
jgi:hypothetical protein